MNKGMHSPNGEKLAQNTPFIIKMDGHGKVFSEKYTFSTINEET